MTDNQAYTASLEASIAKLVEAITAFLAKWDECEPHVDDAFFHRQLRMGAYTGPQFGEELKALRAIISDQEGCGA